MRYVFLSAEFRALLIISSEELQTQIDEGKEKIIKIATEIDEATKLANSL